MLQIQALESGLPPEQRIQNLLDVLQSVHGQVHTRREKNGLHAMLACPKCLDEWGRRELRSRHLALNLDKYLGLGEYQFRFAKGGKKGAKSGYLLCMKDSSHRFSMDELLSFPPLESRGYENISSRIVYDGRETKYLVPDLQGHMIPDHPGKARSINSLSQDHPCMVFIKSRNLDPVLLHRQFRAAWCEQEAPEGEQYGNRWYRKHSDDGRTPWYPGCWKSTPQGRLILYADVFGVQVSWQARYLEQEIPYIGKFVFHPYKQTWLPRPGWNKGEDPVKYITAPGSERNSQLCGFDHVCTVAQALDGREAYCVLTEGPLDAARFPNHGIAVLGKYLSDTQALLVAARFRRAILAFDADKAGREACAAAELTLKLVGVDTRRLFRPEEGQDDLGNGPKMDPGGLTYEDAQMRVQRILTIP